jgi:hypothetical protein
VTAASAAIESVRIFMVSPRQFVRPVAAGNSITL